MGGGAQPRGFHVGKQSVRIAPQDAALGPRGRPSYRHHQPDVNTEPLPPEHAGDDPRTFAPGHQRSVACAQFVRDDHIARLELRIQPTAEAGHSHARGLGSRHPGGRATRPTRPDSGDMHVGVGRASSQSPGLQPHGGE